MSPRVMPENRIADILRAAATVFSRKGYRLAQMEEIGKEANVSKATLYYYFKSKIHLFYYLLDNGAPEEGESAQPPEDSPRLSEHDMLQLLQERLKRRSQLKSIAGFLKTDPEKIDLEQEMMEILGEMWELQERHRIQIIVLEKSAYEFPELAEVFDKYARREVLRQLERYIESRMQRGEIRSVKSVPTVARMIIELLAWFSWKQLGDPITPHFPKSEALPEMVLIFANGLKK